MRSVFLTDVAARFLKGLKPDTGWPGQNILGLVLHLNGRVRFDSH